MEKEENVRLLYLFEGYNESFQADGVLDADGQKMADELRRFADDLRAIRLADLGQSAVSRYAAYVESSVSNQKSGGTGFLPDRNKFMHDLVGGFDPSISAVTAMAPAGIRAALWSYVKGLPSEQAVYAGEIVSVLSRGALDGDALKSAVLARLNASQMNLSETLARSGAVEKRAESALDLRVEKSVTDLMERYAQRGTTASAISTFVSTIADATVQTDAARSVDAKLKSDFATAELTSIRNRLYQIMASASSTTDMKSQMQAYLATIANPDAADVQARTAEVQELEMLDAIAASDSRSTYRASDYPEEMREFVLVRQFNKAREMYANYL
ncbi:MAG TPA: hypothetical protein PLW55_19640, partial [Leptospiraceae bacterium]|nr:hypothetical protein [Leptospiraceae bacterium]